MKLEIFLGNKNPLFKDSSMIREQVFVVEQNFHDEFDEIDEHCYHYVLYDNQSNPIATARSFPSQSDQSIWIIGRVAVLKVARGKRIGFQIMELVLQDLKQRKVSQVKLSAQCRAKGFYEKLGFCSTGEEHMDETCPHVTMVRSFITK